MSKRFKKSKKDDQINIEERIGHLFLGEKDLRLLMLRPIDLIEFSEFAGANSEDIVIWVGKTLAKYFIDKLWLGFVSLHKSKNLSLTNGFKTAAWSFGLQVSGSQ